MKDTLPNETQEENESTNPVKEAKDEAPQIPSQPKITKRPDRIKIRINHKLFNDLRAALNLRPVPACIDLSVELPPWSIEFIRASHHFYETVTPNFHIHSIRALKNPFLELHYHLAKQKCKEVYEEKLEEQTLFHGTRVDSIQGIVEYNFDRSKVINHRFGLGVSFARDALYATYYHYENQWNYFKVMVVAKVFYGELDGNTAHGTIVPEEPSYTACTANKTVFIKYDDASFIPEYVIFYTGFHE